MKKLELKHYVVGTAVLIAIVVVCLIGCAFNGSSDGAKFKREYEKLNGQEASSGKKYQTLKIDKNNKVKYYTMEEAVELLISGTGIVYFGMPDCPWCRGMVPVLLDKIGCSCLENLYYVDMQDKRNTYEIKDGEPTETKKADEAYYQLLEILDESLENYSIKDDDGVEHILQEKRMYLPLVVAVKDGRIVGTHTDSVELDEGQSSYDELTDVQKSELGVIYSNMIDSLKEENLTCDEHC